MTTLTIDTLLGRYHLPPSAVAARERLDRAMAPAFEEALPAALARRGIDPEDGEVCLREVRIPLRVRLSAGNGALVLDWGEAAAEALAAALAAGGDERTVRFTSRRQALAEFALAVARGDLRRVWAFAQLGLCRAEAERSPVAAAGELAWALAGEPEAIVPVLAAVARRQALAALAARIPPACWPELAARALAAAGGAAAIPALDGAAEDASEIPAEIASRILRLLAGSELAAGVRTVPALQDRPELRAAFAALALIEADPGLLRRPETATAVAIAASVFVPAPVSVPVASPADSAPQRPREASPAELAERGEPAARLTRVAGRTDWGGLLFLLALLDELEIPAELAASPLLAGRPCRWSLHRLALTLAPLAEDDPAALAFAGLPPAALPPSAEEPPAAPEEAELFAGLAARILAEVANRLGEPELSGAAVVERVCRRRAEILADPGWFEVRLPLADVTVELRRARLDLDPGYLPFLGAVVRFVYV